jgi:hypothetical protein
VSARADVCVHEPDVANLARMGQWPDRADRELVRHAAACPVCADVALVVAALSDADDAGPQVRVPDAAIVWYGARLLARRDLARRAARPMLVVQTAGAASATALLLAALWFAGPPALDWLSGLMDGLTWPASGGVWAWLEHASVVERCAAGAVLASLVLGPLALYVARLADVDPDAGHPSARQ